MLPKQVEKQNLSTKTNNSVQDEPNKTAEKRKREKKPQQTKKLGNAESDVKRITSDQFEREKLPCLVLKGQ